MSGLATVRRLGLGSGVRLVARSAVRSALGLPDVTICHGFWVPPSFWVSPHIQGEENMNMKPWHLEEGKDKRGLPWIPARFIEDGSECS
jgi:hypothetical protein